MYFYKIKEKGLKENKYLLCYGDYSQNFQEQIYLSNTLSIGDM